MSIAFDIPSPIALEPHHGMPSHEKLWNAATEEEWSRVSREVPSQTWHSAPAVLDRLFDKDQPLPRNIGMFGCHVVISSILQRITFLGKSHSASREGFDDVRRDFTLALGRWQAMWECEPESSLSPNHPQGPILFNSTAILRLAYVRLVSDYSPVRRAFSLLSPDAAFFPDLQIFGCGAASPQRTGLDPLSMLSGRAGARDQRANGTGTSELTVRRISLGESWSKWGRVSPFCVNRSTSTHNTRSGPMGIDQATRLERLPLLTPR